MQVREQWIWLPESKYPNAQNCALGTKKNCPDYAVASFSKKYAFDKPIEKIRLRYSGDTFFRLFCNGKYLADGPALVGGDFLSTNGVPYAQHYATETLLTRESEPAFHQGEVSFYALVRLAPVRICEFSKGRGGFFLHGEIYFTDGTKTYIATDETWSARKETAYVSPYLYDENRSAETPLFAQRVQNIWHTQTSPIPACTETEIKPVSGGKFCLSGKEKRMVAIEYDRIYAGYVCVRTSAPVSLRLHYFETETEILQETVVMTESREYRGVAFHSLGRAEVEAENMSETDAEVEISLFAACYPVAVQAKTETSDQDLNRVLDVCAHSLRYCRQSIHLDSPLHCEPLACTGDYYIETLMTLFTYGDLRLSAFDVRRTAELLRYQDGRIFHTSYSLIWVQMLWDTYRYTGEIALLRDCEEALTVLLERFKRYIGENGLIETPPDYMFVDWLIPDGINLHHPPKALGQTCLNLFYYGALITAAKVYETLGMTAMGMECSRAAGALQTAVLTHLWDKEKGLFFEGLNTPTPEELLCCYMPQNIEKRYYRRHSNILAAYFNILEKDDCRELLEKVMEIDALGEVQPYFMHFWLEAIYRNGLREKYTLKLLEQWKAPIKNCPKGLPEGFYPPTPDYGFDHSHAWAGTPAYALPLALTGLEMKKAGFAEVCFSPSLLGLSYARVEIPTPYGMIEVVQKQGENPVVRAPKEITVTIL